jgi:hypothetical protein
VRRLIRHYNDQWVLRSEGSLNGSKFNHTELVNLMDYIFVELREGCLLNKTYTLWGTSGRCSHKSNLNSKKFLPWMS